MAGLSLIRNDQSLIHFKHRHWVGWFAVAVGAALCYLPQVHVGAQEKVYILYAVGGLFALVGILAVFYRLEVRLIPYEQRFVVTKGFWPTPKQYTGAFKDLEGVYFEKRWRSSGGKSKRRHLVWQTSLKLPGLKKAITLDETRDESLARQFYEKLTRQLRIKAVDQTGEQPREYQWDEIDQSVEQQLADRQYDTVNAAVPPPGLELQNRGDGWRYLTMAPGLNMTTVIGVLFGLPFFLMGISGLIVGTGFHEAMGWHIETSGSMTVAVVVGVCFTLLGALIIKVSIDHAFSQFGFAYLDNEFVYDTYAYGTKKKEQRFRYSDIEDFGIRQSTRSRGRRGITVGNVGAYQYNKSDKPELFLRTDDDVLKIRDLQAEQCEFLRNLFYQHLRGK